MPHESSGRKGHFRLSADPGRPRHPGGFVLRCATSSPRPVSSVRSWRPGKHVFVEKPLALNEAELSQIISFYLALGARCPALPLLTVGFNRRFSPHIIKVRELLAGRSEPLCMSMTVNAGFIPLEHWTQDPVRGGGRIIGEACHFIDLLSYLSGSSVATVSSAMVGGSGPIPRRQDVHSSEFRRRLCGTVHYFANGAKSYPKETLEVFGDGRVIRMENFRITTGYGFKGYALSGHGGRTKDTGRKSRHLSIAYPRTERH